MAGHIKYFSSYQMKKAANEEVPLPLRLGHQEYVSEAVPRSYGGACDPPSFDRTRQGEVTIHP
jgi:hypothetical protein